MKTIYEILEMNYIIEEIQTYCACSLGKQLVNNLNIQNDIDELHELLNKTNEAMKFINIQGRLPLGGLSDIHMSLEKAHRDGALLPEELLSVQRHLECVCSVKNYFSSSELKTSKLHDLYNGLVDHPYLLQEISRCIMNDGTINDHATPALASIRKKMASMHTNIRNTMESYVKDSKDLLSIDSIASRNDRLVLPVKAGYKNEINGLIHDHSATGHTVYIEPEKVVLMNNELTHLKALEREEIQKILYELSQKVKNNYYHFHFNMKILEELDFIFAKAYYGYIHQCCIPQIDEDTRDIIMIEARHPLIDQKKVVANTIKLIQHSMLLISGSNTGGKTVTLKTVGLLSFMALCGLPVPCIEMKIPLFDHIFVDLGDEQSIEQSLSTFSSHMKKVIDILNHATNNSLVILDEIGSGTDPQEGESLAEVILNRFIDIKSFVFATTHYGRLKTFAKEHDEIMLASVSFDLERMLPTYHLKLGSVGQSYAIEISQLLGLDEQLVNQAKELKLSTMSEHEKLMDELEKQKEQLLLKEDELNHLLEKNRKQEKQYQHQLNLIQIQKDSMIKKAQDEANVLIEEAKKNIDEVMNKMKEEQLKQHIVIDAKKQLNELLFKEEVEHIKQSHTLQVGDHVKVMKMNREGDIVGILKNGMINVSIGGLNVKLHEDEVLFVHHSIKEKKTKKAIIKKQTVKKTGTYEINVIGKRYEEAMALVDKFLDDALVLGYPHVRIVHGMGTGVLRKGIRKMLEKHPHVISYRDGGPNEGGLGATLAYFE